MSTQRVSTLDAGVVVDSGVESLAFYTYGGCGESLLVTHAARQAGWEVALLYA